MRSAPDELQTFGGLMPGPEGPVLAIAVTYCGDPGQGDHIIGTLRSALRPASGALERRPYSADFVSPPSATVGSGGFLPELDDRVIDVLAGHFEGAPVASTAMWNDYHGAVTRVGATDMAFPLREAGFDLFMSCTWKTPGQRKAADAWVTGFRQALRPFTRGVYVNSLDEEGDLRAREAYGPNYARLAEIKARYDPTNFFRLNQNIKPA
jgi:hypothetical protein